MSSNEEIFNFDLCATGDFEALFGDDFNMTEGQGDTRVAPSVSTDELEKKFLKKTRQNNNWATSVWREWASARNGRFETTLEPDYPIPENVGEFKDMEMLEYWLQRFIVETRRKDGGPYPPNTLIQIVTGLQRYLRTECKMTGLNVLKSDNTDFAQFRKTLDSRMKELTQAGVGVNPCRADPVTVDDEEQLWCSNVFNMVSAEGHSNAVFFYNGKAFEFRGFQEHVDCQAEQFEIGFDHSNQRKYVKFTPRVRKNSQGGLLHRKINVEPIIHYEQGTNDRSIVKMYEKYLEHVPRKGPLYRKPLQGLDENNSIRYSSGTLPLNVLKQRMKKFFSEANIPTVRRKITNHSARVTLCTSLYNERLSDKAVTSRSKHRSAAVQTYQRENFNMLKLMILVIFLTLPPKQWTKKKSSSLLPKSWKKKVNPPQNISPESACNVSASMKHTEMEDKTRNA
ncbi:uncharacterized protein LOC123535173 [Mercenaria mercenaria]|uniref:uncharacterized protein LOC123535173 n=1 Tax=Mercenaria mercenaria TaxID=6596 RepID=UPI00234E9E75|nr:uncharacterized protein LOC123535173 [Mercenaria mercenaria]